jgi:hypothetical protein
MLDAMLDAMLGAIMQGVLLVSPVKRLDELAKKPRCVISSLAAVFKPICRCRSSCAALLEPVTLHVQGRDCRVRAVRVTFCGFYQLFRWSVLLHIPRAISHQQ